MVRKRVKRVVQVMIRLVNLLILNSKRNSLKLSLLSELVTLKYLLRLVIMRLENLFGTVMISRRMKSQKCKKKTKSLHLRIRLELTLLKRLRMECLHLIQKLVITKYLKSKVRVQLWLKSNVNLNKTLKQKLKKLKVMISL